MEELFVSTPSCFSVDDENNMAIGFIDGIVQAATFDLSKKSFKTHWKFQTKGSVRGLIYNKNQSEIIAITKNRGLSCFDMETGKRERCLKKSHEDLPTSICSLQSTNMKPQLFATADESGEVRVWDLRLASPCVCGWKEQEGDVNVLKTDNRHNLLAASSDGTLAAYDYRKRKLRVKSELMHSELVSLCVTDEYVYAGGRDGYLEVFVHGDYGNILERIESDFEMGVDDMVEIRKGLLVTCSGLSDELKLLNVMPTKRLGSVGSHCADGIDQLAVSQDHSTLMSMSSFACSIKFWSLSKLLDNVPVLRVVDVKKRKAVANKGFYDGLLEERKKKKKKVDKSSDIETESEVDEESGDDDDGEGNSHSENSD